MIELTETDPIPEGVELRWTEEGKLFILNDPISPQPAPTGSMVQDEDGNVWRMTENGNWEKAELEERWKPKR